MADKQHAYELLDQLGPGQLADVVQILEAIVHDEDDTLTGEDRKVVTASREYFRKNPEGGVPFDQVVADLGVTMDQVRNCKGD